MRARGLRAGGEETNVAEVVEGFVAGKVAGGGGICALVGICSGVREFARRCAWGTRRSRFCSFNHAVAEGISDDASGVEVWEHFWAEGVDDLRDFGGEFLSLFAELEEGVGGRGIEGEYERTERFENIHACFTEAEGGEGDGREEDEAKSDNEPEWNPGGHVPLDAVAVGPPGEENGVEDVEERGEAHSYKEFPGSNNVSTFEFDG